MYVASRIFGPSNRPVAQNKALLEPERTGMLVFHEAWGVVLQIAIAAVASSNNFFVMHFLITKIHIHQTRRGRNRRIPVQWRRPVAHMKALDLLYRRVAMV